MAKDICVEVGPGMTWHKASSSRNVVDVSQCSFSIRTCRKTVNSEIHMILHTVLVQTEVFLAIEIEKQALLERLRENTFWNSPICADGPPKALQPIQANC